MRSTSTRQLLTDLREERASVWEQMKELNGRVASERRDLTAEEMQTYERLERDLTLKSSEIERLERNEEQPRLTREVAFGDGGGGRDSAGPDQRTPLLGPEQRLHDWAGTRGHDDGLGFSPADARDFCLGNVMRALVDPTYRAKLSDVESRALQVGVDAQGGFITPEILSAPFIDKVRNAMQVVAAGATTVPLDSDKQSIPRLSGDPTGTWRNENAAFAESQPAFERVTFTPQSYGFIVKTSEELFEDAIDGSGRIIENAITQTAALELDRVAIRGSGTPPEPRGVRNQAGVTIQSLGANGATPTRYNEVMAAISTLLNANRPPTGLLYAPRTSQFYAGLVDTTNQPLNPPQPVADLSRFVTSQIPVNLTHGTSNDTSEVYVGDWRDLLIGIRLGIQLRLLTERYADNGQYAWRVFLRADIQLAHPESFVVITGVRP